MLETGEEIETEEIVTPLSEAPEGAVVVRRYLVKFSGRSQLHNEWWSYDELLHAGIQVTTHIHTPTHPNIPTHPHTPTHTHTPTHIPATLA